MLTTPREGNTTQSDGHGQPRSPAQPSKVVDFPRIPWWRCGRSVILTAGTLLARILCGLYSNGNHFGAGGEAVIATP